MLNGITDRVTYISLKNTATLTLLCLSYFEQKSEYFSSVVNLANMTTIILNYNKVTMLKGELNNKKIFTFYFILLVFCVAS